MNGIRRKPKLAHEALEERRFLSADGLAWGNAPYLTLSFAPDGTQVDDYESALFGHLNELAPSAEWQSTIVGAFQSWASQTNGDIGVVADSGDDFGVAGNTSGDERFGDVRIGAIPLRESVYAIAVRNESVAGTWAGDVLFNTNRLPDVASLDEVFRIALHEAGHVFGFGDSEDLTSPMHSPGIPTANSPNANDLDELWSRFGQRSPDIYDRDERNDTADRETHLYSSDSGFDGRTPLITHADIGWEDRDYYRLDILDNYQGTATIEVRTETLSQLQPTIRVFERESGDLGDLVSTDFSGEDGHVSVTLSAATIAGNDKFYIEVDGLGSGETSVGGYALVVTFDQVIETSPDAIDRFAGSEFRFLESDDIRDIFSASTNGSIPFFRDDMHLNDSMTTSTVLDPVPGFAEGIKYEVLGSISDDTDVDYYSFRSADYDLMNSNMNTVSIHLESVAGPEFAGDISVVDSLGNVLAHTDLLNQNGQRLIQVAGLADDAEYFLRVSRGTISASEVGNYRLTIRGGLESSELATWREGTVEPGVTKTYLRSIQEPELVLFAIQGHSLPGESLKLKVFSRFSTIPVLEIEGDSGSFVSGNSVLLDPGLYRVSVEPASNNPTSFTVFRESISDPLAVAFTSVTRDPVVKISDVDDDFVFPAGPGSVTTPAPQTPSFQAAFSWALDCDLFPGEYVRSVTTIDDELQLMLSTFR